MGTNSLSQAGLRPELRTFPHTSPSRAPFPRLLTGQGLHSLFQRGRQSILQVNTAINNGVRRPVKEGGEAQAGSPPGPEHQDRRTREWEGFRFGGGEKSGNPV